MKLSNKNVHHFYMQQEFEELWVTIVEQWRHVPQSWKRMLLGLVAAVFHTIVFVHPVSITLNSKELRHNFASRGDRAKPLSVIVVRVDEQTYGNIHVPATGFLPRQYLTKAIRKINAAGPKAIVLDFFLRVMGEDPQVDRDLAQALAESPSVIGRARVREKGTDPYGQPKNTIIDKRPHPFFRDSAKLVIPMQAAVESDRVIEQIALPVDLFPHLGVNTPIVLALRRFVSPDLEDPGEFDYINYYGGNGSVPGISFSELLDDSKTLSPDYFKDRVVFIGLSAHAAKGYDGEDLYKVPIFNGSDNDMYGVEIQAHIAADLLDKTWIRRTGPRTEIVVLNILALLVVAALMPFGCRACAGIVFGLALIWERCACLAFTHFYYFLPGASLFLVVLPCFVVARFVWYLIEEYLLSDRRQMTITEV